MKSEILKIFDIFFYCFNNNIRREFNIWYRYLSNYILFFFLINRKYNLHFILDFNKSKVK